MVDSVSNNHQHKLRDSQCVGYSKFQPLKWDRTVISREMKAKILYTSHRNDWKTAHAQPELLLPEEIYQSLHRS